MARAMSASGLRNPKAILVSSRSRVFMASTRALERSWRRAASMPPRCSVMERASLTKAGSRQRRAHTSQSSRSRRARHGWWRWKT